MPSESFFCFLEPAVFVGLLYSVCFLAFRLLGSLLQMTASEGDA